ncbi:MAG: arylsulfotransferase family protein [Gammaproteobacteria bacterium]
MRKTPFAIFLLAIVIVAFIGGGIVVLNEVFPTRFLYQANLAGHSLFKQKTKYSKFRTDLWEKARTKEKGVVVYDQGKAYSGYTLYSSADRQSVYLIDMHGRVVHTWHMDYSSFWDKHAAVKHPVPATNMFITKAYLYPNGDLLAVYVGVGNTPWGAGMVKMDGQSKLIWKYMAYTHHDVDVAPDGDIYVLTQAIVHTPIKRFTQLKPPWIEDYVVILSPQGKVKQKIALTPALLHSPWGRSFAELPWFSVVGAGDYLHTNAVQYVDAEEAKYFPRVRAGDVLVSFREMNMIAILDPRQKKIVWALRGSWIGQHDPVVLPDGDILMFDNNGHFGPGGRSRDIEINPKTGAIVWSYTGDKQHFFQSIIRGGQQRLPNGNTLITEEQAGTLLEVTPDDQVVWKFVNPVRGGPDNADIPVVSVATRIKPSWLDPAFRREVKQQEDKQ